MLAPVGAASLVVGGQHLFAVVRCGCFANHAAVGKAGHGHRTRHVVAIAVLFGLELADKVLQIQRKIGKVLAGARGLLRAHGYFHADFADLLDVAFTCSVAELVRLELTRYNFVVKVLHDGESGLAQVRVALKSDVELYADPLRFKQILLNLMGNAVKFTPDGGTVEVGLHSANGVACLYVRDSGPGVHQEDQARVFEEYYQGTEGKDSRVGSGLGLAITRRLVEEHGGKIWVKSEPGRGTEFFFTMPRSATA